MDPFLRYAKFTNIFPELKATIQDIFRQDHIFKSTSHEIQQRANEYFNLTTVSNEGVMTAVLEEMPMYPEDQTSLLAKLDKSADVTDRIAKSKSAALTGLDGQAVDTGEVDEANVQRNSAFLDGFRTSDKGTLFDSPVLQVGCMIEVQATPVAPARAGKAVLTLYYGNKAEVDFTGVTSNLSMPGGEDSCVTLSAQELPPSLQQGQQVPQKCEIRVESPYSGPVTTSLSLLRFRTFSTAATPLPCSWLRCCNWKW
jgi:AP-2 complex subunit alpha